MNRAAAVGIGMVLLAAALWGTTGTAQSLAPPDLPAHWVGALRLLVAGGFLAVYVPLERRAQPLLAQYARVPWRWVLLAGVCVAAYNLTFFAGVRLSSVAVGTAIAIGSGPIWAGLLQTIASRRSPSGVWWVGSLLAVAGASLMVLGSARQLQISLAGVGLCLGSGLAYAAYTLISKQMVGNTPASIVAQCIFSCAALIAAGVALAVSGPPSTTLRGWGVVLYLGVAATGVAYLLFSHALRRISGTTAVSMVLAEPLTAFCLAILVVGEQPPAAAFAGLALVMLGLALVVRAELRLPAR